MSSTSHSLLEQLRGGRKGVAWERWHALYEPLIRGWLRSHELIPADRDDLVQDVLTVVVRRIGEFEHNGRTGAFRLWLKTITINCLREHWKELRQHPRQLAALDALDDWASSAGTLSRMWDAEHDRHLVHKLFALLRPEFSDATWNAFRLLMIEGRPAAEVAVALGLSVNAVYIAKSRVLTRLRHEAAGLVDDAATG